MVERNSIQGKNFKVKGLLIAGLIGLLAFWAASFTKFDPIRGILALPEAIGWMLVNFIPDQSAFTRMPNILVKLHETIFLSIAATTTAAVFAFFCGLMGSGTTSVHPVLAWFSRLVASCFRNVPEVVWAMFFLITFGQNVITGYCALFFVTFGILTRAFIESIDEASKSSVEALHACGASWLQLVFQAVLPSSLPQILSWILFMIETNIRSATLIGLLTGTGVGHLFTLYYRSLNYSVAGLIVLVVIITILVIEALSNYVRRLIL